MRANEPDAELPVRHSDIEATHFESLRVLHRTLDAVFALHQELLVVQETELAEEVFALHLTLLRLHMKHEEEWLLPIYCRQGALPRFPEVLYLGQHRKMLALLERVELRFVDRCRSRKSIPQTVLAVLDLETTYKHLSEHHDQAEAQGLFKVLDQEVPASDRYWIVQRCFDEFLLAVNNQLPLLRRARQRVSVRARVATRSLS